MAAYNRFGAAYTDIPGLFPGSVADDFGGQSDIETIMDMVETEMASRMNPAILRCLTRVDGMIVEEAADAAQTVIDVPTSSGILYANQSGLEVWVNFASPGVQPKPGGGDSVTVADNGGAVRLTMASALSLNDVVIMSCDLDPTDSSFAVETLKRILIIGTASMCGHTAYDAESITPLPKYEKMYTDWMIDLGKPMMGLKPVPEFANRKQVLGWNAGTYMTTGDIIR